MHNLNDRIALGSGWDLLSARGIDDDGRIVGFGVEPGGSLQAYLLVPPEGVAAPVIAAEPRFDLAASPSPFRSALHISFALPRAASVRVTLHDVHGRRVAVIEDGAHAAGPHELTWDDAAENMSAPGVYFVRLVAAGRSEAVKVVRVR